MDPFFTAENNLAIITSKDEVDAFQWRKYIEKNWDDLKQKDAKLLCNFTEKVGRVACST